MEYAKGGYITIDLGMTYEEFGAALEAGEFDSSAEQYKLLETAVLSGKPIFVLTPQPSGTIPPVPQIPVGAYGTYVYDLDDGIIETYGVVLNPIRLLGTMALLTFTVSHGIVDGVDTYSGAIQYVTISN